jgi:hypothetical protein
MPMIVKLLLGIPAALLAGLVVYRAVVETDVRRVPSLISIAIIALSWQPLRRDATVGAFAILLAGTAVACLVQEYSLRQNRARTTEPLQELASESSLASRRLARRAQRPPNRNE